MMVMKHLKLEKHALYSVSFMFCNCKWLLRLRKLNCKKYKQEVKKNYSWFSAYNSPNNGAWFVDLHRWKLPLCVNRSRIKVWISQNNKMYDFIWVWGSKQNSVDLCYCSCLDSEKHLGMQDVANRDCLPHLTLEFRGKNMSFTIWSPQSPKSCMLLLPI